MGHSGGRTAEAWLEVMNRLMSRMEQAVTFKGVRSNKAALGSIKLQIHMCAFMVLYRSVKESALTTVEQHKYMQVPARFIELQYSDNEESKTPRKFRYAHWIAAL